MTGSGLDFNFLYASVAKIYAYFKRSDNWGNDGPALALTFVKVSPTVRIVGGVAGFGLTPHTFKPRFR